MKNLFRKEKLLFHFRLWALPAVLIFVFALQQEFPAIHRHCALWSEHPCWWQFFTCNFLSQGIGHLVANMGGLMIVYSQFAPKVRAPILVFGFVFFATLSTWIFHEWWMPRHAWLIGASGGSYALMGFFSWFLRRARFHVYKCKWLNFRILPVMLIFLAGEYLYARWRMPSLAWQMHAIGFGLGIATAMAIHAADASCRAVAVKWPQKGVAHRFCSFVSDGMYRVKEFSKIPGKDGDGAMRASR